MSFGPLQDVQISLGNLQEEMNRMLERVWHGGLSTGPFDGQNWAPPIDLYEHRDRYTLLLEIPGVDVKHVDVTTAGDRLTIRGEKQKPAAVSEGDRALRKECRYGCFSRTIELPSGIDAERLSAKCRSGVLEITIPKSKGSMPTAVKIEVVDE